LAVLVILASSLLARQQGQNSESLASIQGIIRDSRAKPVADVAVYLQSDGATPVLITHTAADGTYQCARIPPGTYTLHSTAPGFTDAAFGPFTLHPGETKKIDLELAPRSAANPPTQPVPPQLYDEPQFTIAGVADANNLGGHGSTATVRETESLTKGVTSLDKEPAHAAPTGASAGIESLRSSVAQSPNSFQPNRDLGAALLSSGQPREAIPYLKHASQLDPGNYDNSFDLARAFALAGDYQQARSLLRIILVSHDRADAHRLLADVEEKLNDPLASVQHYQRAAELDPSEPNLFDWGAELLVHHANEPATEVFAKGNHRFPASARLLIGLAVAWNARGVFDKAVQYLCQASDLNPADPTPYLFLGRIQNPRNMPSEASAQRLERFARLQPQNALANYYYAVSLWQGRKAPGDSTTAALVESHLQKAVELDPNLGLAYLQLGIFYAEKKDFSSATAAYRKAIEVSPELEEAHYRLSQAYLQIGEKDKAQQEIRLYDQLSKKNSDEFDRERRSIPRFVYTLRDPAVAPDAAVKP
jgi:tetratricopeptide (TPR) repeat protein